ncbi:unnamed protein product, partial [Allacma fusca]
EEIELRKIGGFKQLSRKVLRIPFKFHYHDDDEMSSLPSFRTVTRLLVDMPFTTNRLKKLQALEEDDPKKFKKFAQKLNSQPFQLTRREKIVPAVTPGRLKGVGRQLIHQPFRVTPKPKPPAPEPDPVKSGLKFKGLASKAGRQPFGLGVPTGPVPEDGSVPDNETAGENVQNEGGEKSTFSSMKFRSKTKSMLQQPFGVASRKTE